MNGFSTADGFVEITEDVGEMIKYVANEPSVGLFYVQQHAQSSVPNLVGLNNCVVEKSRATALHTEDLEDSATMVSSMKECGSPIASGMIKDIKNSLLVMSTRQPKRSLIRDPPSELKTERSSWGPSTWGRGGHQPQIDSEKTGSYLSTVLMTAKQKASNFKWQQNDLKESERVKDVISPSCPPQSVLAASFPFASAPPDAEADELPVSSHITEELREQVPEDESLSNRELLTESENYDVFRADKEAKLREWLEGGGNPDSQTSSEEEGP